MNYCAKPSDILSAPEKWTKGAWARDVEGHECDPKSSNAVRWSLVGAFLKCSKTTSEYLDQEIRLHAVPSVKKIGLISTMDLNDHIAIDFFDIKSFLIAAGL